jgi:hypothetical protein
MKMRYHFLAVVVLMFLALFSLEAQQKKRLAVLPFTGGSDEDNYDIAFRLSYYLEDTFTILDYSVYGGILEELRYQEQSGLVSSDVISRSSSLRERADFVVSGFITSLGSTNLVIISIMDIAELQQIAGVYVEYGTLAEIGGYLQGMAQRLIESSQKEYRNLRSLAIPSFTVQGNANAHDAMVLAQILAAEIANSGVFAVFPRDASVADVVREHQQSSGLTANTTTLGRTSQTIEYYLNSIVMNSNIGASFSATIIELDTIERVRSSLQEYTDITDAVRKDLMRKMAEELTGVTIRPSQQQPGQTAQPQQTVQAMPASSSNSVFGFYLDVGIGYDLLGTVEGEDLDKNSLEADPGNFWALNAKIGYGFFKFPLYFIFEASFMTEGPSLFGLGIVYYPWPMIQLGISFGYSPAWFTTKNMQVTFSTDNFYMGQFTDSYDGYAFNASVAFDFFKGSHSILLGVKYTYAYYPEIVASDAYISVFGVFVKYTLRRYSGN